MITFPELVKRVRKQTPEWRPPERLLAVDPGETTGWALFANLDLVDCGQIPTKLDPAGELEKLLDKTQPLVVVAEDYRIYKWKAKQHTGSDLFTPRLLGALDLLCHQRGIPLYLQMAQLAKVFCTDDKLKHWGFYKKGQRHARDAIRHGCYWLVFGKQ